MTTKELVDYLKSLTVNELREKMPKGYLGKATHCPVATYIKRELKTENVKVTQGYINIDNTMVCVPSRSLSRFIFNFDSNEYPELVEHCSACGSSQFYRHRDGVACFLCGLEKN